ncbi:MAG: hypothetical protein E5X49_23220 [Mesorhizobium sp.]|uniref:hypothetical protein n=1 Tax=Mesorhizobium sp. TaxID=1871066 RepID=UPI000FE3C366|nr:hypothetical protein [Mesorhizobium sp.]RWA70221.1 MAG: hypothetical protein EOQ28_21650 [Mesorhizobium sp.]RWB99128.1 MAG: hypothetical protein EOQ57_20555 [Mesorhizobium sp.]RWG80600.1 MAG: hypothetical protein EOQ69_20635 [Mesorhizobium sp.]RWK04639.1 MAG: hypothetical protein EOR42_16485 [Mesorhizobium sp.]RWK22492.1 MAG: hypothetical protein EOR43_17090 [Mesorhizobium sp.]
MRAFVLAVTTGCLICTPALAADKTVHDEDHGFSLTYPEQWTSETTSGDAIRLKVKSGENGLTCRVSENLYDPTAPDNPSDPRAFIEKDWSLESWQTLIGAAFGSASFSNDRVAKFPDGYPVRIADMDFRLGDGNAGFYGRAKIAISIRRDRYGFVTCGLMGNSADEAARMWAPLADEAERVVNSFALDAP